MLLEGTGSFRIINPAVRPSAFLAGEGGKCDQLDDGEAIGEFHIRSGDDWAAFAEHLLECVQCLLKAAGASENPAEV